VQHGDREAPIRIRIEGSAADRVELSIHNGGTIPDDARADLFSPFKTHAKSGRGVGLGLYIVSLIVKAHAGVIDVHSSPSEGTTFAVRLPRQPELPSEDTA
jgi:signal transduction histidine kinase